MKEIGIAILMITSACGAQNTTTLSGPVTATNVMVGPAQPPLDCGKYQHVFHWPGSCGLSQCDGQFCASTCSTPPPDKCVDDMHEVTEREWQQLMDRLRALESKSEGQ